MKHEIFDSMKRQLNPSLQAQAELKETLSRPAQRKPIQWRRYVAVAACAALVMATFPLTQTLWDGSVSPTTQPSIAPLLSSIKREVTIHRGNVVVNESDGVLDTARLYRDPSLYDEEILDAEGVSAYYGRALAPAYIPDGLTDGGNAVSGCIIREKATGNVVEDQAGRSFWVDFWEDGSPKSDDDIVIPKGFSVEVSKLGILHCGLLPVDEAKPTDFNGVSVTLSHASLPYGPFDPEKMDPSGLYHLPAGYYDIYVASFTLDGVEYEIQTQRLELEELIKITASLIGSYQQTSFTIE